MVRRKSDSTRNMDAQEAINQQEWERPDNWSGRLGRYRRERDTRLWVPKPNPRMGWTLNFAHPQAWVSCVGLFSVPIGLLLLFVLYSVFR
jgi:uncharacterized membrane protein